MRNKRKANAGFRNSLRGAIKQAKTNAFALSQALGWPEWRVSELLRYGVPPEKTDDLVALADALHVSIDHLLGRPICPPEGMTQIYSFWREVGKSERDLITDLARTLATA